MWALNGFDIKMIEKSISIEKILIMGPTSKLEKQFSLIPLKEGQIGCGYQVVNKIKTLNYGKKTLLLFTIIFMPKPFEI